MTALNIYIFCAGLLMEQSIGEYMTLFIIPSSIVIRIKEYKNVEIGLVNTWLKCKLY